MGWVPDDVAGQVEEWTFDFGLSRCMNCGEFKRLGEFPEEDSVWCTACSAPPVPFEERQAQNHLESEKLLREILRGFLVPDDLLSQPYKDWK